MPVYPGALHFAEIRSESVNATAFEDLTTPFSSGRRLREQ